MNPTEPMSSKTPEDNSSQPASLGNAREPLLSDEDLEALCRKSYPNNALRWDDPATGCWRDGARDVLGSVEDKITTGELRVVTRVVASGEGFKCGRCKGNLMQVPGWCPNCGAQILPLRAPSTEWLDETSGMTEGSSRI